MAERALEITFLPIEKFPFFSPKFGPEPQQTLT